MKNIPPHRSEETKKKISMTLTGRKHSKERCKNISEDLKGNTFRNKSKEQKIVICPHCLKEGGSFVMKRWHFNNCKEKIQ